MKFLVSTAVAAALVLTLPGCSQETAEPDANAAAEAGGASIEALNGAYKLDLASLKFEQQPDEYLIQDGTYNCKSCTPPLTVAADGAMHAVADRPYYDELSVKVVDDRTVEMRRNKDGREVGSMTATVSEDGNALNYSFVNSANPNAKMEGKSTASRVGPAPEGAHAMSGQWMPDRVNEYSEEGLVNNYSVQGDTVTWSGQGQSYTAQIGGPAVPIEGDNGGTTVQISRGEGGTLVETYMRGGKEVGVGTVTPSADGQSISYRYEDKEDGSSMTFTANKQA